MKCMHVFQVLDGDGEQGERVRSEGVLELQQNWQRLGEGFSKTLSLGSPEPGGQSYTVELKVSVLELIPVPGVLRFAFVDVLAGGSLSILRCIATLPWETSIGRNMWPVSWVKNSG